MVSVVRIEKQNLTRSSLVHALEVTVSGRTRMNKSWYTINDNADNTMTFNNQATASVNWTWDLAGLTFKSDYNFNWYNGYSSELNYTPEHILNAEIQKLLFNNTMTIALKGYDILGQAKNLSVSASLTGATIWNSPQAAVPV